MPWLLTVPSVVKSPKEPINCPGTLQRTFGHPFECWDTDCVHLVCAVQGDRNCKQKETDLPIAVKQKNKLKVVSLVFFNNFFFLCPSSPVSISYKWAWENQLRSLRRLENLAKRHGGSPPVPTTFLWQTSDRFDGRVHHKDININYCRLGIKLSPVRRLNRSIRCPVRLMTVDGQLDGYYFIYNFLFLDCNQNLKSSLENKTSQQ